MTDRLKTTKHVSRACLECRTRHIKCSGSQPCTRCTRLGTGCTFVKSQRGGSRKKGVSKFDNKKRTAPTIKKELLPHPMELSGTTTSASPASTLMSSKFSVDTLSTGEGLGYYIPPVEDLVKLPCVNHHKKSHSQRKKEYADLLKMPCAFTCLEPQYKGHKPPCMGGEVRARPLGEVNLSDVPIRETNIHYNKVNSRRYIKKMMEEVDLDQAIDTYYDSFHKIHPVLPDKHEIYQYLSCVPHADELVLAMKIMGDAQSTSLYASDIETVNFKLNQIFDYINTSVGIDIVSLQAMTLISLIAHFSSLHDLSSRIRIEAVKLILDQGYHRLDAILEQPPVSSIIPDSPESEKDEIHSKEHTSKVFESGRVAKLSPSSVLEYARKVFWELLFVDVIVGTADGRTISKLATAEIKVKYPQTVSQTVFDYKTRLEACLLVTGAIRLNISVIEEDISLSSINQFNTLLGTWDMRMTHPELMGTPLMVSSEGYINEGVFQAMLLYNYARIFAHRPFSYLWKDMSPKIEGKLGSNKLTINSRKVIETRRTIEGANLIGTCLLDTRASSIQQRTPLYGCSVAFASLVHISSYIWAKSKLDSMDQTDEVARRITEDELKEYLQFIQFELGTLVVISKHWMLPNKLLNYVRETLGKVAPDLSEALQTSMTWKSENNSPEISIGSENELDEGVNTQITFENTTSEEPKKGRILNFSDDELLNVYMTSSSSNQTEIANTGGAESMNEIDFTNYDFNAPASSSIPVVPDSPMSDTGCDWIDRNIFEFDEDEFRNILESSAFDE